MNIVIDIETVSTGERLDTTSFSPPANYSKKETIDEWYATKAHLEVEKEWRKRALVPHKCQVVAWAIYIDEAIWGVDEDEGFLLEGLQAELKGLVKSPYEITWVGANIRNFDIPIIRQRAWKYGLTWLKQALAKPQMYDLIDEFTGSRGKEYLVSKDEMCSFFGIENKDGMDGSKVQDLYPHDLQKIAQHCVYDVEKEYELFKKMI